MQILGPDDREIYQGKREKEGKYFFIADQEGFYKFCFSNRMSTLTPKTVVMDIKVGKQMQQSGDNFVEGMLRCAGHCFHCISYLWCSVCTCMFSA